MDVFSGLSPLVVAGGGGHFGGGRGQSAPRSGLLVAAGLGAGLPDPTDSVAGPGTCGSWLGCGLVAAARPGGHLAGLRGFACGRVGRPVVAGVWHRSVKHTSLLPSLIRLSYVVLFFNKNIIFNNTHC